MLYAGETPSCALWETELRDVVPSAAHSRFVAVASPSSREIAKLRLARDIPCLDLRPLGARSFFGTDEVMRNHVAQLAITPEYPHTHSFTAEILKEHPTIASFQWHSRQTGETAYIFFAPPLEAGDFEIVERFALDSTAGLKLINKALRRAGLIRADSEGLSAELEPELPPNEPE